MSENYLSKKTIFTLVGAVTIGIIASGLYDLVVKPGINFVTDWSYNLISFFSETIENSPFSSAALDPTIVPSLFQMTFFTAGLPGFLLGFSIFAFYLVHKKSKTPTENDNNKQYKKIKLYITFIPVIAYVLAITLILNTLFSVVNKSVFIHRVFRANLAICTPFISEKQRNTVIADFAKMETKNDYLKIQEILQNIANQNGVELRKETIK
jgi:hypothetical protein